jgi:aspartate carbamoyltransferase catalytic subunit
MSRRAHKYIASGKIGNDIVVSAPAFLDEPIESVKEKEIKKKKKVSESNKVVKDIVKDIVKDKYTEKERKRDNKTAQDKKDFDEYNKAMTQWGIDLKYSILHRTPCPPKPLLVDHNGNQY